MYLLESFKNDKFKFHKKSKQIWYDYDKTVSKIEFFCIFQTPCCSNTEPTILKFKSWGYETNIPAVQKYDEKHRESLKKRKEGWTDEVELIGYWTEQKDIFLELHQHQTAKSFI